MEIEAGVSLKSIEFKSAADISSVRCTLTNGVSSPLFEKAGVTHNNPIAYNFDANRKVCKVEASTPESGYLYQLKFFDSTGAVLFNYNPHNQKFKTIAH